MAQYFILLPILFPALASLLMTRQDRFTEEQLKPLVLSVVCLNFLLVLYLAFVAPMTQLHLLKVNDFLDIYFRLDNLGKLFSILASFLWILTSIYAFAYMSHEDHKRQFYVFFTMTLSVTLGLSFSGNLFTLYIYYELLTLVTFPLVIHAGTEEALQSGKKYIIYSFSGATLILFGMMILYPLSGDMIFVGKGLLVKGPPVNDRYVLWSFLFMFLGFGVKSALVPLHAWLPSAMVAPTPVSALLHAVAVVKSGIFSLIRITYFVYGVLVVHRIGAPKYLIPLAIITVVMGSLLALHQQHLKKRLAYSTVSQLGYIILGLLMLNPNGLLGSLLHLVNHALIKITLFFSVGIITHQTGKKYIDEIYGLGKRMPITFICFMIATISLIGIPPSNGFVSKWFLGLGSLNSNNALYLLILLLSAFLTASYLLPIPIRALFTTHREEEPIDPETPAISLDPGKLMRIPLLILTGTILLLGLFPNFLVDFLRQIIMEVF